MPAWSLLGHAPPRQVEHEVIQATPAALPDGAGGRHNPPTAHY